MEAKNGTGSNPAFADALARAKQIAAKINQPSSGNEDGGGIKRPFDGSSDSIPEAKKLATSNNDHMDGGNRSLTDQQRAAQAAQAAAAAASQINAKLGISTGGQASSGAGAGGDVFGMAGISLPVTETIYVPDRMVGLLIGKGGEQIAAIQSESECRVQFAPDSGGMAERQCTLTGTASAIEKAKEAIGRVVNKTQGIPSSSQEGFIELMVSGSKVGLIIGKGGEMIRQLQDRAGVKIVVIQDTNTPTNHDKPVRITGDKESCQRARDMILDLLADKDMHGGGFGGDRGGSRGGPGLKGNLEIPVPRSLVGVIIGKGGEMIRKIQEESGARVQFKAEDDDGGGPTRVCSVTGSDECRQTAANMIRDLIDNGLQRQNEMGGGGHGQGRGPYGGGDWGSGRGGPGGQGPPNQFQGGMTTYGVPAEKCGLVIGKGGETVREINRISGAHVELLREPSHNPHEKLFRIQGSPDQIQNAIRLIHEKAGLPPVPDGPGFHGPPGHPGGMVGGPPGQVGGPPMGGNPYGPPNPQGGPPRQTMPQQPSMAPQQPYGVPGQMAPVQPQGMVAQPPAYGQPWPGAPYQQPYPQPSPQPEPNKPAADPNAAAWAAYYAQFYGQAAVQPVQQAAVPQPAPQQLQPVAYSATPAASVAPAAQPQPTINPQTGQPDYSLAWAEYYRQQGMHQHAAAILQASQHNPGHPPQ